MVNKQVAILLLGILLFSIPSYATTSKEAPLVEQFGVGFDEVVIADSSDALSDPRDLEFHPGRANELWVANRNTDSITIIEDTGLETQTSQNRKDSNRNHFLEEVSAISFGAYHPEFDWQWGSAQETRNTFCGQGTANNFMGPTLWPSSLSHFAMENQNNGNGLLGSHIDMNHESPYGVGIAHDYDNVYWYNDGYYGELVRYDFKEDHDTGEDDHSDSIVRRYSDITLTHAFGIPGHMILDQDSGILYIADAGANRVLWVNTDDTTYTSETIVSGYNSGFEPLAEYSSISGIEWGVLATGLNRPSGIALDGDQLFVSQNGNGKLTAFDLNSDGKGASEIETVQTSASSIMGLEIGPNGHLYYVDNGRDEVIRIDPYMDADGDGVGDDVDNCPFVANAAQANHDGDAQGDLCDLDDDNDAVLDIDDDCALGNLSWLSSSATDHDMDGCADLTEDNDDDNDGMSDDVDYCSTGDLGWTSSSSSDYDLDGCRDAGEDYDDDNDRICDAAVMDGFWTCSESSAEVDLCPMSAPSFSSIMSNDGDQDGCEDDTEDLDDDNDGFSDIIDNCPDNAGSSDSGSVIGCADWDDDGYADSVDEFPTEPTQWSDLDGDGFGDEIDGLEGDHCPTVAGISSNDRIGCLDTDRDGWSDPDATWLATDGADAFPTYSTQHADRDGDGYGDSSSGYRADICPDIEGTSTEDVFGCLDTDGDGWSDAGDAFAEDATQYVDADMDGYGDSRNGNLPDSCPGVFGTSTEQEFGCPDSDGDGWGDNLDVFANDVRFWSDIDGDGHPDQQGTNMTDDCPEVAGNSNQDRIGCLDTDGDGWSDEGDVFPNDAARQFAAESSSLPMILAIAGIVLVGLALVAFGVVSRRGKQNPLNIDFEQKTHVPFTPLSAPVAPTMPTAPAVAVAPPLPPEGLPPGWTMEQWAWYGADYLKNR
ncbi:MAG: thrombospondin type 3 repeat-containing protein [Candidatus Poseidoniaceae archaeon]|nr:thrombospondin type 3 repeat-containing protein [Candidatus Poseidoniaceae archaeon]